MQNYRRVILFVTLFWLPLQHVALGQLTYRLAFLSTPSEGSFSIRSGSFGTSLTPGGSLFTSGQIATFKSFEQFHDEITGIWMVDDGLGNLATFEIESFKQSAFPVIELLNPREGEEYQSGSLIDVQFLLSGAVIVGNLYEFDPLELDLTPFFNLDFIFSLQPGIAEATAAYQLNATTTISNVLSNIDDSAVDFTISPAVNAVGRTANPTFRIANLSELGDINRDGAVNLLDIQPFVDVLSGGSYQFEADTNEDGVVSLLDVASFVDLLN